MKRVCKSSLSKRLLRLSMVVPGVFSAAPVAGQVQFTPAEPERGATVVVAYRGPLADGGADSLRLRGRLRALGDPWMNQGPRQSEVAILERDASGVFRGSFRLPDDVVFGIFAVEDVQAESVDDNVGRLWELFVHEGGRPLMHALEQRISDLTGRNSELILETAERMTQLYPDSVYAWHRLARFQGQLLQAEALEASREAHQSRLLTFHNELSALDTVPPTQMESMVTYHHFSGLGQAESVQYWRDRLDREHPSYPMVLMFMRQDEMLRTFTDNPGRYLDAVEPLWQELLEQKGVELRWHFAMANNALNVAHRPQDPTRFTTWLERYSDLPNMEPNMIAARAEWGLSRADLRPYVLRLLREQLEILEGAPDSYRPLERTRSEHRLAQREMTAGVLGVHATALLAQGDTAAALDTLRLATGLAWVPENWRKLARVRHASGDAAGALTAFAAVAADPMTSEAYRDSVEARFGDEFDVAAWEAAVDSARGTMARIVASRAEDRQITTTVVLRDVAGEDRSLQEIGGGKPLAVVFWSPNCFWSRMALPDIQRAAEWAERHGARLVVVSETPADSAVLGVMHEKVGEPLAFDVFSDPHVQATAAFQNFGFPSYHILEPGGRVPFHGLGGHVITLIPLELLSLTALTKPQG